MSERPSGARGQGNVAAAMRRRVGANNSMAAGTGAAERTAATPIVQRRRKREKPGKRSDPKYMMAGGYVRKIVHERVMEALANRTMREALFEELDAYGVEHDGKRVYYGDLVELLCVEWLEGVGIELE